MVRGSVIILSSTTLHRKFVRLISTASLLGVTEAERLLSGLGPELTETMLFVFFKGRIQRLRVL